jgi:simple sugar transport system permease protein
VEELLVATLRLAAPLLLAALGELVVERAGVVNIGIEGMMLAGAFTGFAVGLASGSPAAGAAAAVGIGALAGLLFAAFAMARKADQIVVGMALSLLALGATGLVSRALYAGAVPTGPSAGDWAFVGAAALAVPLVAVALARTRWGLRLRAVGESARAADAEGVPVDLVRTLALLVGGAFAGLAGASLSLSQSNTFSEGMTAGRGFIALAIVIFGRWRPAGVLAAALFFGAATALQFRLQARGLDVPYPAFLMLPYAVTLLALAIGTGGARAPADLGRPWQRE